MTLTMSHPASGDLTDQRRGSDETCMSDTVSVVSTPRMVKAPKQRRRTQKASADGKVEPKNVTAACQFCRRLRRKCEGGRPCNNCVRAKSQCIFDKQPDRRHREYKEKVSNQLNQRAQMYDALIEAIKVTDETELIGLIHDLKNGKDDAIQALVHRARDSDDSDDAVDTFLAQKQLILSKFEFPSSASKGKRKRSLGDDEDAASAAATDRQFEPSRSNSVTTINLSEATEPVSPGRRSPTLISRGQRAWPWFVSNGSVQGFGNLPISSAVKANNYPAEVQKSQLMYFQQPEYLTPSLLIHNQDGLPIWNLCTSFSSAARNLLHDGISAHQVVGSGPVDVSLLFRQKTPRDFLSANAFACDIARILLLKQTSIQEYKDIDTWLRKGRILPEDEGPLIVALALVSGLTRLTRWNLLPTSELYGQIPEMSRPIAAQRLIPHFPDVDLCIHPVSRRCLMRQYRNFSSVTDLPGCGASINWPHSFKEALTYNAETGQIFITREFEEFASRPNNWSWSPKILEIFPEAEEMGGIMVKPSEVSDHQLIGQPAVITANARMQPDLLARIEEIEEAKRQKKRA